MVQRLPAGRVFQQFGQQMFPQLASLVVAWPRVSVDAGIKWKLPFFTRLISRSMIPSSGGLRSSSAELMASTCALIFSSYGAGS